MNECVIHAVFTISSCNFGWSVYFWTGTGSMWRTVMCVFTVFSYYYGYEWVTELNHSSEKSREEKKNQTGLWSSSSHTHTQACTHTDLFKVVGVPHSTTLGCPPILSWGLQTSCFIGGGLITHTHSLKDHHVSTRLDQLPALIVLVIRWRCVEEGRWGWV